MSWVAMSLFIQLTKEEDKGAALASAVAHVRARKDNPRTYKVAPESFELVPGSPFAYWISERIRRLFKEMPAFEADDRSVRIGMKTGDDFRFLRSHWECYTSDRRWIPYAKGGTAQRFYAEFPVVVNWHQEGREVKAFVSRRMIEMFGKGNWEFWISNSSLYFRPGLTWPLRAAQFSPQALPVGCIFSVRGYAIIAPKAELLYLLGLGASSAFDYLFKVMLGRFGYPEFIVGVLQRIPLPDSSGQTKKELGELAHRAWTVKRNMDVCDEVSHAFILPSLLYIAGGSLANRVAGWAHQVREADKRLVDIQRQIDDIGFKLYGINDDDRRKFERSIVLKEEAQQTSQDNDSEGQPTVPADSVTLAINLMSWLAGAAFGRWDLRLATGERHAPPDPDPFDPLPVFSPGMLIDSHGVPEKCPPKGYPIEWPEDGILVDDVGIGGVSADRDIIRHLRQMLEMLWGDKAGDTEQELCGLLGVRVLRDYFRRPSAFFDDHLKRYSKSKRKAPIYWPLSTASGSYSVWVYYPLLTSDTVYKIVSEHVGPKIGQVEDRIAQLEGDQTKGEGSRTARAAKELAELTELLGELKELREELLRAAKLPYKPDLNDGVQITAAPLWRLFRLPRWRAELEKTWKALERGDYDWAHLAYVIWPERVRKKCKTDKSLAIAHGLEQRYEDPTRAESTDSTQTRKVRVSKATRPAKKAGTRKVRGKR